MISTGPTEQYMVQSLAELRRSKIEQNLCGLCASARNALIFTPKLRTFEHITRKI
jgi:hypothetical protein